MSEFRKATKLSEVASVVDLEPLKSGDDRYFDMAAGRGRTNPLAHMRQCLLENDAGAGRFAKIAFTGHRGCGKTTELLRFEHDVSDRFTPIHVVAEEALLGDYDYTDLFLWLVDELMRQFERTGTPLDASWADDVANWFAEVTLKNEKEVTSQTSIDTEASAGAKPSLFGFSLGILARIKSMVVGSTKRRAEIRLDLQKQSFELVRLVNFLLDRAHETLRRYNKPANLLIVVDNLDRLSPEVSDVLFFKNGEFLKQLNAHLIYTVPIATVLAPNHIGKVFNNKYTLPMVKVRHETGRANTVGLDALQDTIEQRLSIDGVFTSRQMVRKLAEMSGGNIRDFMRLVQIAQRTAIVDGKAKIDAATVSSTVRGMRLEYEQILIPGRIYYPLLAEIHRTKADGYNDLEGVDPEKAQTYRAFFSQFLFNGSVLEYNGDKMWYDVHPVIQEIEAFKKALKDVQHPSQDKAQSRR